jgi:hypothetical protein
VARKTTSILPQTGMKTLKILKKDVKKKHWRPGTVALR